MVSERQHPLVKELRDHISDTLEHPDVPLDKDLFDLCRVALITAVDSQQLEELLPILLQALFSLQQNPSPLCELLIKLLHDVTYEGIAVLGSGLDLAQGLTLTVDYYHELTLFILDKAAESVSGAESIARQGSILEALVVLMLASKSITIAEHASQTIVKLLAVDQVRQDSTGSPDLTGGQGLVWKRLFQDSAVYHAFYDWTSWDGQQLQDSTKAKTVAQSRLLGFVEEVTWLDCQWLMRSHDPDIEKKHGSIGLEGWGPSLLDYVALRMIKWNCDDPALLGDLLNFMTNLAHSGVAHQPRGITPPMRFLIDSGLHQKALSIYLEKVPSSSGLGEFTISFLYAPASRYIAVYANLFPKHLRSDGTNLDKIITHIAHKLEVPEGRWTSNQGPNHDLDVMTCLPITSILYPWEMSFGSSLISRLPKPVSNAVFLNCLSFLFSGNRRATTDLAGWSDNLLANRAGKMRHAANAARDAVLAQGAGARIAYYLYLDAHPEMWNFIIRWADNTSLAEFALPALSIIDTFIHAHWNSLPLRRLDPAQNPATTTADDDATATLPTEESFLAVLKRKIPLPAQDPITALLQAPDILDFLFSPPRINKATGASSDSITIARRKFELLRSLAAKLEGQRGASAEPAEDADSSGSKRDEDIGSVLPASGIEATRLAELRKRLRERISKGVWGEGPGARTVVTMER